MHRSWCAEHPGHPSNERLEFLGDSVLGLIVTDHVYRTHADLAEGDLTEIRKTVVNSVALAEVAEGLGVGEHMLLGKGEELSGGREKPSILADAMEAIIGAVYIASGMDGARDFVLRTFEQRLATARADGADHKSRLQELTAHRFGLAPHYEVEASGPDHARSFTVTVTVDGTAHGTGVGRSKKQAEQQAARQAVAALTAAVVHIDIDIEAEVDDPSSTEPAPLGEAEAEPSDTRAAGDDAGDDLEEIHHG